MKGEDGITHANKGRCGDDKKKCPGLTLKTVLN
jgi:hypothetical protein